MAKLSQLEMRIASPAKGKASQSLSVVCYQCGEPGHIARVCRAVLPDPRLAEVLQPKTSADGHMRSAQNLTLSAHGSWGIHGYTARAPPTNEEDSH